LDFIFYQQNTQHLFTEITNKKRDRPRQDIYTPHQATLAQPQHTQQQRQLTTNNQQLTAATAGNNPQQPHLTHPLFAVTTTNY
jgi:hypothetical protein